MYFTIYSTILGVLTPWTWRRRSFFSWTMETIFSSSSFLLLSDLARSSLHLVKSTFYLGHLFFRLHSSEEAWVWNIASSMASVSCSWNYIVWCKLTPYQSKVKIILLDFIQNWLKWYPRVHSVYIAKDPCFHTFWPSSSGTPVWQHILNTVPE